MKSVAPPKSDRVRRRNNWIIFAVGALVAIGLYVAILMRATGVGVWAP